MTLHHLDRTSKARRLSFRSSQIDRYVRYSLIRQRWFMHIHTTPHDAHRPTDVVFLPSRLKQNASYNTLTRFGVLDAGPLIIEKRSIPHASIFNDHRLSCFWNDRFITLASSAHYVCISQLALLYLLPVPTGARDYLLVTVVVHFLLSVF